MLKVQTAMLPPSAPPTPEPRLLEPSGAGFSYFLPSCIRASEKHRPRGKAPRKGAYTLGIFPDSTGAMVDLESRRQ